MFYLAYPWLLLEVHKILVHLGTVFCLRILEKPFQKFVLKGSVYHASYKLFS